MSDWNSKKQKIENYYSDLISEYGHDPRACDYGRPESQQKKFTVLSDIITPTHKALLDVGCGFADYADFLKEKYPHIEYNGVDITKDFVEKSKARHPDLNIKHMDIMEEEAGRFDIVTANGIFYLLGDDAENTMRALIEKMYSLCLKSVAFNSLSAWADDQEEGEFYADPLKTADFCRSLTPWVTLRHDYHSRDFTIYLHREQIG